MVHKTRTMLALLTLLGGVPAVRAQAPLPNGPGPAFAGAAPVAPPVGGPMGLPRTAPGWGPALIGQPEQEWPGKLVQDPLGPHRMQMPTPVSNTEYAGGSPLNYNTRPDERTLGIRLDTSYDFGRETEFGVYLSEYQSVAALGVTVLPYQAPCFLLGWRLQAVYNGNNSVASDILGASTDVWFGTRFKSTYLKFGTLVDWTSKHRKYGFTNSVLSRFPLIGNWTYDGAYAFESGADQLLGPRDPIFGRLRRVEMAFQDYQMRLGKYLSTYVQVGMAGHFTYWREAGHEFGAGAFTNLFVGSLAVGMELTGGRSGARGYFTVGYNWGGGENIDRHPIDARYDVPIDTVGWVTRAPRRDITMQLRESFTGPPPPQIVLPVPP